MNETNAAMAGNQISLDLIITVIQDVLKRWYLIVAAALIAAMATFIIMDLSYQPEYSTTATLVTTAAGASNNTYQNLSAASSLADVLTEALNSSLLRKEVLEQTGISNFDGTITASVIENTNLMNLTVTGSDPRTVFLMSKGIIEHHHVVTERILGSTMLEVLREPTVPTYPINVPDIRRSMMKMAMLAAIAVAAVLGILFFMADKVRSKDEADTKLSCRVLGELYHERKYRTLKEAVKSELKNKKKSILITDPLTSFVYTESIHKLSSRMDKYRHKGEHVIMVTSLLENEGKSTVAVNLALSMAKRGKKVLLMDCDLRKPACGLILGSTEKSPGTVEVLRGKAKLNDCVKYLENSGLYLMSGRKSLRTATDLVNSSAMKNLLREASSKYDMVIVDTPPMSVAPDAECISEYADAALLVVRQNAAKANDLNDAVAILGKSNVHLLGCVLNNVYGFKNLSPVFHYGDYDKYGKYSKYGYGKYGYGKYSYGRYGRDRRKGSSKERE